MSRTRVHENWSEYDDKKKKYADANFFACTEKWEVEYLTRKIFKEFPQKSKDTIENAVSACCKKLDPPHPRKAFVDCVLDRLGL